MSNRIAEFLDRQHRAECPYCLAFKAIFRMERECRSVNAAIGDVLTFALPCTDDVVADEGGAVRWGVRGEVAFLSIPLGETDVRGFVAAELHRVACLLFDASEELTTEEDSGFSAEGGAA